MGITAAYEAAKLPPEEQKAIADKVAAGEDIVALLASPSFYVAVLISLAGIAQRSYAFWVWRFVIVARLL